MKKNWFFPVMIFAIVFFLTNGCKKNGATDDDAIPSASLAISSLKKNSALPVSQLLITGSGFSTDDLLVVRFSDDTDYQIDIPVFQSNGSQLIVSVPPYINTSTKDFTSGTVSVQVIIKNNTGEKASNKIENFEILEMPAIQAKAGMVTLLYMDAQLKFYNQLLEDIVGTELATSEIISSITNNKSNLVDLYSKIKIVVESPTGLTTFFKFGSINGQEIKIGSKELEQCDRLILSMFAALKSNDIENPLGIGGNYDKSLNVAPCLSSSEVAYNDLLYGTNSSSTYSYYDCLITSLPTAINTASNVVFGAGSVGLGIVALGALAVGVPVSVAIALPAAAITYATIMTGGIQITLGASLKNLNDDAALKLINSGVKQIDDMFVDMALGTMLSDFAGAVKDLCTGTYFLGEAFSDTYSETGCTYTLSESSIQVTASGGNGTVSVTTGSGCSWTAVSGYAWITITNENNGTGNGVVSYSIQANTDSQQRSGSIQIAGKSFSITQEANAQSGPYDGNWTFTMVGTFTNATIDPPTWPYPETSSEMSISGHDLIGWGEYGIGVLGADGYAAWTTPANIFNFSGTFYSSGTGIGSWTYGPDTAGTTGSGTWNATKH